ncbi:11-S seed storage protein [Trema orientale]|uniref:11-S seed storage protein n=1 Tax=Trema orientale TaxID=63057 RepID=A0A2P5FLQ2_TREOI|nr:11-S seed storage protein [Trema orientale]
MASKEPVGVLRSRAPGQIGCSLLCLSLLSLLLSNVCLAQQQTGWCQFERLKVPLPNRKVESKAGISEYWDIEAPDAQELKCAGMSVVRYTLKKGALLLPSILNAPLVYYVLEGIDSNNHAGKGLHGAAITGCAQTYEAGTAKESREQEEQHQKVRNIEHGDIVAKPAGIADWVYNYGNETLILIAFIHVGNHANQLDIFARRFHLAGQGRSLGGENPKGNVFSGLDVNTLARAYNVGPELASKLQSRDDLVEEIVQTGEDFHVLTHALMQKHKPHRRNLRYMDNYNGEVAETFCNFELRHNIDDPDQSDIFNLRGGRVSMVTSFHLPIFGTFKLTAERAVVYDHSMMTPYFNLNSHSVFYVTYGSARVQVADEHGRNVFDGELKSDDVFVLPQNYVIVKETTGPSFEYIAVKTNDKAARTPLAGRISVIRALPDDVVALAFGLSREEARSLKYSREEITLFRPDNSTHLVNSS